mmetsp:Transcript_92427/g.249354  ORF Transcript_92427/g.249354 Transcript_92427/m.249354 type:complete len:360 (-) Transcript_92427:426-1505(-)|eukprot:CAMPEP_0177158734 /NCGR_PEP_ID=MMETSP0367-20130122/3948_1 /TAXON_ID=447022 ORGANISM="Scrippsiella hangoei-like, Strain SHHI-4" /NCGR_SAMPLE_ID=MMETSP0367 /ASSEMBLY_ACC=CAM_ASM_000362 /LENGTH=359 /DNA_ID=CAMNT_0018604335 /DNA_START=102 /DNA_END=1181 /DNA_ORIENTATION=-
MPTLLESLSCCYGRVDRCDGVAASGCCEELEPATKVLRGRMTTGLGNPLQDPGMLETVRLAEGLLPGGQMTRWQHDWCTAENVRRYFHGRHGNPLAAAGILAQALQWREEYREVLSGEREPVWQTDLRVLARGEDGVPIIYGCFRHNVSATASTTQHIFDHMAAVMEAASREKRYGATNADTILDCHGYRMVDNLNPAPMLHLMKMANQPYRDGLRTAIVIDAPTSFYMLWRAAQPFLSEKTKSKVRFVSQAEAVQLIASTSGAKAAATVKKVMALNRAAKGCKGSRFPSELSDDNAESPAASEHQGGLTRTISRKLTRALSGVQAAYKDSSVKSRLWCCRRRRHDTTAADKSSKLHIR